MSSDLESFLEGWIDDRERELAEVWRDIESPDPGELAVRERFEGEVAAYQNVLAFVNDESTPRYVDSDAAKSGDPE